MEVGKGEDYGDICNSINNKGKVKNKKIIITVMKTRKAIIEGRKGYCLAQSEVRQFGG